MILWNRKSIKIIARWGVLCVCRRKGPPLHRMHGFGNVTIDGVLLQTQADRPPLWSHTGLTLFK